MKRWLAVDVFMNSQYGWSMEQVFKVFSTANLYCWSRDSSFADGVCGLIAAVDQLYPSQSAAMEDDIVGDFTAVGVGCPAPLEDAGTFCARADGVDTYCFFEEVSVSDEGKQGIGVVAEEVFCVAEFAACVLRGAARLPVS